MSKNEDNFDQIPSSEKIGETEKIISEQGGIEGERKDVNVEDYPKVAKIGNLLKDVDYPANKNTIINTLKNKQAESDVIDSIEKIEEKLYRNTSEVLESAKMVYK